MADAVDFKFDVAIDDHDPFIGGMHIAFPALAGWFGPEVTTQAALMPVQPQGFDDHGSAPDHCFPCRFEFDAVYFPAFMSRGGSS